MLDNKHFFFIPNSTDDRDISYLVEASIFSPGLFFFVQFSSWFLKFLSLCTAFIIVPKKVWTLIINPLPLFESLLKGSFVETFIVVCPISVAMHTCALMDMWQAAWAVCVGLCINSKSTLVSSLLHSQFMSLYYITFLKWTVEEGHKVVRLC